MKRQWGLMLIAGLLLASGICERWWFDKETSAAVLDAAVARLHSVPLQLGDWQGEELELPSRQVEAAELAGYIYRYYEDRQSRQVVGMLLVCGPAGPISVHTPDVCFRGIGFHLAAAPILYSRWFDGASAKTSFLSAGLSKRDGLVPLHMRILWGWSESGPWLAPEYPRIAFAGSPVLYKLYVFRESLSVEERLDDDPCVQFLKSALPALEEALFPGPA